MPALNLSAFQAEVARDLLYLRPGQVQVEFPAVTEIPAPWISGLEVWSDIYERRHGHPAGAVDQYETEAARRLWRAWEDWQGERQGQWRAIVAPADWSGDDLQLWAAWWRRQPAAERSRWAELLAQEPGWWHDLVAAEQDWWQKTSADQADWLAALLAAGRERRHKGFLGRLQPPDDVWQEWLDAQGEQRLVSLERDWLDHRAQLAAQVQRDALKQQWLGQVGAGLARQLKELADLRLEPRDYEYWATRANAGPGLTFVGWTEFQEYWRETGESRARELLGRPDVRGRVCAALGNVRAEAGAIAQAVTPALLGLVSAGGSGAPVVPLVHASLAVVITEAGVAAVCSGNT